MKLLAFIGWAAALIPIVIILAKLIGWLSWTWLTTIFLAVSIPLAVIFSLLALAVFIIKTVFADEWNHQ